MRAGTLARAFRIGSSSVRHVTAHVGLAALSPICHRTHKRTFAWHCAPAPLRAPPAPTLAQSLEPQHSSVSFRSAARAIRRLNVDSQRSSTPAHHFERRRVCALPAASLGRVASQQNGGSILLRCFRRVWLRGRAADVEAGHRRQGRQQCGLHQLPQQLPDRLQLANACVDDGGLRVCVCVLAASCGV